MLALLRTLPPATCTALAATQIEFDQQQVAIVGAPSYERERIESLLDANETIAAIDDGQEYSLVVPEACLARLNSLDLAIRIERPFHFLRLNAVLPWSTVGYGAAIFAALADAGVSAGMLSGFSTDYLLIPSADLPAAAAALDRLFVLAAQNVKREGS